MFRMTTHGAILYAVMVSNAKHPLAGYTLSTRVVAGRLRGDSSLMFRMTCPHYPNFSAEWCRCVADMKKPRMGSTIEVTPEV